MEIVEIEWLDSQAYSGWMPQKDMRDWNDELLCRSVGYLLREDKDRLVLVASESVHSFADGLSIPRVCVRNIYYLTRKRGKK